MTVVAVACLAAAWSGLFAGQILGMEWASTAHTWIIFALVLASGAVAAVAGRSARTRLGIALALVLTAGALASVRISERDANGLESSWWRDGSRRVASTLLAAGEEIARLEAVTDSAGSSVAAFIRASGFRGTGEGGAIRNRFETFAMLDSLVERISGGTSLTSGTQIGIQLFDAGGERFAWAGWPRSIGQLDRAYMASGVELVYSRKVSLYRILTRLVPVFDEQGQRAVTVLIDLPLEVNYRVNNRFLESASLTDNIASDNVASVSMEYTPALNNLPHRIERFKNVQQQNFARRERLIKKRAEREQAPGSAARTGEKVDEEPERDHRRRVTPEDSLLSYYPFPEHIEPVSEITGDRTNGLQGMVLVRSSLGNPIATVWANSHPFRHYAEQYRTRWLVWARAFIVLALFVMFVVSMYALNKRRHVAWTRGAVFIGFMLMLRYSLLSFQPFVTGSGSLIFDPTVFATPILGGIARSAGDLMITGVFYVTTLYGLMKMMRPRNRGENDPVDVNPDRNKPVWGTAMWAFVVKGLVIAAVFEGVYHLTRVFARVVVVNSNPRLIGETMRLTDMSVLVLHLGTFFVVTGIMLTGMLAVWGMFRLTGWKDAVRSSWTAFVLLALIALAAGPGELLPVAGLLLAFAVLAPRYVQREDLVSIVLVSFCLVIITSGLTYLFFSRDYDDLRKNFIQEKLAEMADPTDHWKRVILEDVLNEYSRSPQVRRVLEYYGSADAERVAFDLWAGGPLSLLGYSCAIHVVTERDSLISGFSVDMPYRVRISEEGELIAPALRNDWVVMDMTRNTPLGIVRYYRGIVNLRDNRQMLIGRIAGAPIGKVIVDVPFSFENLEWAARTGPRTPEVLRNIQEGGVEPRVEEPEALLLARLDGRRIAESSSEGLPVGITVQEEMFQSGLAGEWPRLNAEGRGYRFLVRETDAPGSYLLAGFATPSPKRHLIRWSALFSLYLLFTTAIIATVVLAGAVPYLKELLPTLTPGRKLGFQQKLLASFLLVALVPAVILGLFSIDFIKGRFVEENRREAVEKLFSARKALVNLLHGEMRLFLTQTDMNRLFTEDGYSRSLVTNERFVEVFNETGETGPVPVDDDGRLLDKGGEDGRIQRGLVVDLTEASTEDLYLLSKKGKMYIGVLSAPIPVSGADWKEDHYVYFARRVDAELLGDIADQVNADVNVFDAAGDLVASSQEGLLAGGLISSTINSRAYVDISLFNSNHTLATERTGSYSYQVAYLPVTSWGTVDGSGRTGRAALSVPLVFLPESYSMEIQKTSSIVLGIFALLFMATIGLGLLLARGIFEPLRGLLEGTRRIIRGDLNVRLPLRRSDEIGIVVSAFNEMTEQLSQSQRALEERQRYLETILVNIGTGVISTDTDGRIRTVNSAAERILGIKADAALGQMASDMANESQAAGIFEVLRDSRETRDAFVASEVELKRDGRTATIKYMLTKLNVDDRYLGTVFVFEDLTELIHTKKLSAWVEMARQIAHEIKNPLTPIRISTQFMQRAYEQKSEKFDEIFTESSKTIIQQVDVLKRIASEFSSYGRMQQLEVEPQQLAPLLDNIIRPYMGNSSGVSVEVQNSTPGAIVFVDAEAVRKICSNLIENALEAMPNGGRLEVACRDETISGKKMVSVSFHDNGTGLSSEAASKLFEPYFSTKTTGTGLGLAICRSLSREMGGDIEVHDAPGGGVEARVLFQKSDTSSGQAS